MNKIIFCDKNKEVVNAVKLLFESSDLINNTHCELIVSDKDDVFECKKDYPNAKILTASNPNFTMGGGLDLAIKEKYHEQCLNPREFLMTNDLFFVVSVDKDIKATDYYIKRAMFGSYMCSRKNDIIITGIGTGIGGLSITGFITYLKILISANFSNTNFSNSDFSDSNFCNSDFSDSNFCNSDFSNSKFMYSNFCNSNFSNSNFSDSDFSNSKFIYSNFCNSNFRCSDFSNSNFMYSNFMYSNFMYSNFSNSNFSDSNFNNSSFMCSNFNNSNFSNSNFSDSDFSNSNFSDSNFSNSDFSNSNFNYRICPQLGLFIGWKKCKNNLILKLEIQDSSIVSGGFINRKLRTNKVKVLEIQNVDGTTSNYSTAVSGYDTGFKYTLGETVEVENFKKDDKIDCDTGIHFFMTREEAVRWQL